MTQLHQYAHNINILTGPFRALLINFVINIFLLLLYVNNSGGKPEFMEYCLYFACSNILYVLGKHKYTK